MTDDDFIIEYLSSGSPDKEGKIKVTHKKTGIAWTGWNAPQLMKACYFDAEIHMLKERITILEDTELLINSQV